MDYGAILEQAHTSAREAIKDLKEDMFSLNCGFQWIVIEDGRHPFVNWCRKQANGDSLNRGEYGEKAYPKGWTWWNVGNFGGQDVDVKRVAGQAFVKVLAEHNIKAVCRTRLD